MIPYQHHGGNWHRAQDRRAKENGRDEVHFEPLEGRQHPREDARTVGVPLQPKICDAADQKNVVVETKREDAVEIHPAGRQQRPH